MFSLLSKKIKIVSLLIPIILLFIGCEGYRCAMGFVYDSKSHKVIDSVLCKVLTGTDVRYTDSTGYYIVCNNFGGCVPDCSDIEIEYSKPGYKTKKLTNPEKNDIFLEKE